MFIDQVARLETNVATLTKSIAQETNAVMLELKQEMLARTVGRLEKLLFTADL